MSVTGGDGQSRLGTAFALFFAGLAFVVLSPFLLVLLPLVLLLWIAPEGRQWGWVVGGTALAVWLVVLPTEGLGLLGRGWALLLGSAFLVFTLLRPRDLFLPRALAAVAASLSVASIALSLGGGWGTLEWAMRDYFHSLSLMAVEPFVARATDPEWASAIQAWGYSFAEVRTDLFPAFLALQSLSALGLAWWAFVRLRGGAWKALRPLREFRFNDQLVWFLIVGLVLVLLPLGAIATRAGANALLFMGGLYILRGLAVFAFLAGNGSVVLGALAAVFLFPLSSLILTAALLVGVGDTWFDVRRRVLTTSRA